MTAATAVGTLAVGAVFGLALAAPPGPMNAVIAEESVLRGWLAGFRAGLGAMAADALFFLLSLLGVVTVLEEARIVRTAMLAAGGVLMLYFAVGAAREARSTYAGSADPAAPDEGRAGVPTAGSANGSRGFRKAFVLALTNPYQVLFWLTVGVGLLRPGTVDVLSRLPAVGSALSGTLVVRTGSPLLLAGLFAGICLWIVAFPAALVRAGRRVDAFAPLIAGLSAVVLAGFGVAFLWRSLAAVV